MSELINISQLLDTLSVKDKSAFEMAAKLGVGYSLRLNDGRYLSVNTIPSPSAEVIANVNNQWRVFKYR